MVLPITCQIILKHLDKRADIKLLTLIIFKLYLASSIYFPINPYSCIALRIKMFPLFKCPSFYKEKTSRKICHVWFSMFTHNIPKPNTLSWINATEVLWSLTRNQAILKGEHRLIHLDSPLHIWNIHDTILLWFQNDGHQHQ